MKQSVQKESWKLLYDNECSMCRKFAHIVERFDRDNNFELISLQDYFNSTGQSIPLDELQNELHIINESGHILKGGGALQKIISLIPAARPFQWMINSNAGERAASALYASINRFHRRCSNCGK